MFADFSRLPIPALLLFVALVSTVVADSLPEDETWPSGYELVHPLDRALELLRRGQTEKILGGREADPAEFPWQVSVRFRLDDYPEGIHFCGGSLIGSDLVLTAAHCFVRRRQPDGTRRPIKAKDLIVAAGGIELSSLPISANVKDIVSHEDYHNPMAGNDLALLRLEKAFPLSDRIAIIDLDDASAELKHGDPLIMTGWGYTSNDEVFPPRLQAIDNFPAVLPEFCNRILRVSETILQRLVCGGSTAGEQAGCRGDSGGPLARFRNNHPELIGVISFRPARSSCERPQRYTVATRVSHYRDWIKENQR